VIMDHQMKAFERMQSGEYEEAVNYYKLAIEEQPNDGYIYASLGDAYYELGDMEQAIAQYEKATEIYNDYELFAGLGDLYRESERLDEAVEAYLKTSELAPNNIWVQLAVYQHLAAMERWDDALVVEERIEAFQAMQDEYLKELSEQEEQQEQDAAEESEDVAVPEVNEEPTEDTESKVGDSDLED